MALALRISQLVLVCMGSPVVRCLFAVRAAPPSGGVHAWLRAVEWSERCSPSPQEPARWAGFGGLKPTLRNAFLLLALVPVPEGDPRQRRHQAEQQQKGGL